jgi:hypothetical protein
VKPTSLPQTEDEKDDVLTGREPVHETTSNFTTSWLAGDMVETTFDWSGATQRPWTRTLVSRNDRTVRGALHADPAVKKIPDGGV